MYKRQDRDTCHALNLNKLFNQTLCFRKFLSVDHKTDPVSYTHLSKNSLKKMLPLSEKKNFVLNLNSIQNCWTPESRYVDVYKRQISFFMVSIFEYIMCKNKIGAAGSGFLNINAVIV